MFERFTDRARQVVLLAQEEARLLRHDHVGPEHLLLGLLREGTGVAAMTLREREVDLDALRERVEAITGRGESGPEGEISFTPSAKKTMELSFREALRLGHDYIGTEHLLLGMLSAEQEAAARVLAAQGLSLRQLRRSVLAALSGKAGAGKEELLVELIRRGERAAGESELIDRLRRVQESLDRIERRLASGHRPRGEPDWGGR